MRRQVSMDFAGGRRVFPVAASTSATSTPRSPGPVRPPPRGPPVSDATRRPRGRWCAPPYARPSRSRVSCWLVRRTRTSSPTRPPTTGRPTGSRWDAVELSLTDFLNRRGLVLRTTPARVLDAWLTPVFEPKRYRTWFFVALLPSGQITRDV